MNKSIAIIFYRVYYNFQIQLLKTKLNIYLENKDCTQIKLNNA